MYLRNAPKTFTIYHLKCKQKLANHTRLSNNNKTTNNKQTLQSNQFKQTTVRELQLSNSSAQPKAKQYKK